MTPRLLVALERLDPELLAEVLSVRVEPRWPVAVAVLELRAGRLAFDRYDVHVTPAGVTMAPRPPGPRAVELETPIRGLSWSHPEPVSIEVDGGDLWGQCLEVVRSGILGTAEAAEHRVMDPDGAERLFYLLVGRGRPRSPERAAFLSR